MAKNSKNIVDESLFLPMTASQMKRLGWKQADIILVTGDAYVDHPSFGAALIGRYLQGLGFKVAMLAQPDYKSADAFRAMGPPRLFWGVTSGNVDSRLNDYASMGHKRKKDSYSPNGEAGLMPKRSLLTYSARCREAFADVPIVLGGLEASLRRLVHFDFIEDKLKRSVLVDAKADMLVHGMGELAIAQIAQRLNAGEDIHSITDVAGTAYRAFKDTPLPEHYIEMPGLVAQQKNPESVMEAQLLYQHNCIPSGKTIVQDQDGLKVVVNPPSEPLSTEQLDEVYKMPFTRTAHPCYKTVGDIPALEPVQFSITTHRGCFGGCSFCSIYYHQGKQISSRSVDSIMTEAQSFLTHPEFKGTIPDMGGPSANMYGMGCSKRHQCGRASCIHPNVCEHLSKDYRLMLSLMRKMVSWKASATNKGVNVFIASGVRYDMAMWSRDYMELLAKHFVSGQLKVAPEHYSKDVLDLMGKPGFSEFEKFETVFEKASEKAGKKQYIVPYFISSHPGCSEKEAVALTEFLVNRSWRPRQVQDFVPVPLTLSTAMFVSGVSQRSRRIFIPKGLKQKRLQAALLQYYMPENYRVVEEALNNQGKGKLLSRIRSLQLHTDKPTTKKRFGSSKPTKGKFKRKRY